MHYGKASNFQISLLSSVCAMESTNESNSWRPTPPPGLKGTAARMLVPDTTTHFQGSIEGCKPKLAAMGAKLWAFGSPVHWNNGCGRISFLEGSFILLITLEGIRTSFCSPGYNLLQNDSKLFVSKELCGAALAPCSSPSPRRNSSQRRWTRCSSLKQVGFPWPHVQALRNKFPNV